MGSRQVTGSHQGPARHNLLITRDSRKITTLSGQRARTGVVGSGVAKAAQRPSSETSTRHAIPFIVIEVEACEKARLGARKTTTAGK